MFVHTMGLRTGERRGRGGRPRLLEKLGRREVADFKSDTRLPRSQWGSRGFAAGSHRVAQHTAARNRGVQGRGDASEAHTRHPVAAIVAARSEM